MFVLQYNIKNVCVIIVGIQLIKVASEFCYHYFLPMLKRKSFELVDTGQWAVITGSTNTLSRAFGEEFASLGMNLVFIDRNSQNLVMAANELATKYKIRVKIISNNFAPTTRNYKEIQEFLSDLDIGILVNNLHENYTHPEYFINLSHTSKIIQTIIETNIYTTIFMCKIILPGMIHRKRGLIINVASFMVDIPAPMVSIYAASKSFVEKFSQNLMIEHQDDGVFVRCILPGFIDCKWLRTIKPSILAPSSKTYVNSALPLLAVHERTLGYYAHTIFVSFFRLIQFMNPTYSNNLEIACMEFLRDVSKGQHTMN